MREYAGADRIEGPLVVAEGYGKAAYGELVEVHADDRVRLGQVLTTGENLVVAELWSETAGLQPHELLLRFRGETFHTGVSREMLGRVFDGLGRPRDGLPPPMAEARVDMHGAPLNPTARAYPQDFIETGISAIDGMNTVVRGQKLPIFSGAGLPHNELAAQIALQARIAEESERLAVVFVALGVSHDTAAYFQQRFEESGLLARTAVFLNLADESPLERMVTPRVALSLAEFLAFEHGYQVLVLMTDITNYAEALREISSRRNEVPGRKAYPGYLYSDLAEIFERCGRVRGRPGSVTQIPILTMPGDDITHPVPDLTGYITEGQIVLSRALHREGIYPPIDVLPSLSRLMKNGIGERRTRADHPSWAAQLYASYARVQEIRAISVIIGETALTSVDRAYLEFGREFERRFLAQAADQARSMVDTLDTGWEILSLLPSSELTRINEEDLRCHYSGKLEGRVSND
ncbi:MAG: V-type ATP synthase subunit B [Bryobacteraceae bacterium]|jgi:V/A-type H+-transporting ATPase subunit B